METEQKLSVAVIMDGNGRWAKERGHDRVWGHVRGLEALRRTVRAAIQLNVGTLYVYAFSTENWGRDKKEIETLMRLGKKFFRKDVSKLHAEGVRVRVIGSRIGVDPEILDLILEAERLTDGNKKLVLVFAFNYGGQDEIARSMWRIAQRISHGDPEIDPNEINKKTIEDHLDTAGLPVPDLLIRTSGEQRISNFLLWQLAYTEFIFVQKFWPDFGFEDLKSAIEEFQRCERRFGC